MKRISLVTLFILLSFSGFSATFFQFWGGAGVATKYNYDAGISTGISFFKGFPYRVNVGASVFLQQYNLYYDKENSQLVGGSIRHNSSYAFVSPVIDLRIGKYGNTHFYLTAGAGFNMNAVDTLHKWDRQGAVTYDSTIGKPENINKMVVRLGMGLSEYFPISQKFYMNITEDVGFLANKLSETNDPSDAKINNNVGQIFRPTYISIRIGFGWKFAKK